MTEINANTPMEKLTIGGNIYEDTYNFIYNMIHDFVTEYVRKGE